MMGWFGSKDTKTSLEKIKEQGEAAQKEIKRIIATPEGATQALVRALGTPNRRGVGTIPDSDPYSSTLRSYAAMALGNHEEVHGGWACCICNVMFEDVSNAHNLMIYPKRSCSCNVFDPRAVEPLIKALEDEDWSVRSSAASALGMIGDERAAEPLSKTLRDNDLKDDYGSSFYVRKASAQALGEIGGTQAFNYLFKEFIKLPSPSLPQMAALFPYSFWEKFPETANLQRKRNYDAVAEALKKFPETANEFERLELYDKANEFYKYHDMLEEAAAIRRKKAEMAGSKTIVHGDYVDDRDTTYVDDRDTIIQDSVVSKSNIGAGGKSKAEDLREAKSLFEEGLIDESEYKQMKKEILGK